MPITSVKKRRLASGFGDSSSTCARCEVREVREIERANRRAHGGVAYQIPRTRYLREAAAQTKSDASSVLPVPVYFATCGYGHMVFALPK